MHDAAVLSTKLEALASTSNVELPPAPIGFLIILKKVSLFELSVQFTVIVLLVVFAVTDVTVGAVGTSGAKPITVTGLLVRLQLSVAEIR